MTPSAVRLTPGSRSAPSRTKIAVIAGAAVGGTTAVASAAGSLTAAAYFARKVLTPDPRKPDDVVVREVASDSVLLDTSAETVVPGRYGLWLDNGDGHARLGEVLELDATTGVVRRELLGVDDGDLRAGTARWNGYYFGGPPDVSLGLPTEQVLYDGELGRMPAWVVAPDGGPTGRWAVLVHGRGARREETVRAVRPLLDAGWTCLVPTYRNDEGVPGGPDGRYALGLSEWRDVDAAVEYAVGRGATEVLLGGWSMGGAIVLQFLDRSERSDLVSRVVLDAPVVDWGDVLSHHARAHHVPRPVGTLARAMMHQRWGHRFVGVHEGVDLALTDWVRRAEEVHHRILLIHSADDEFVPFGPSFALAQARPDLVTFEEWRVARHCKEWNTEPERWEALVRDFATD